MKLWALLMRISLPLAVLCVAAAYLLYTYKIGETHSLVATEAPQQPVSPSKTPQNKHKTPPLPQTLPYAKYLKSIEGIQRASWTTQLYDYLKNLKHSISPHVNMVFGDSNHMDLVLNWIIAAHVRLDPPLHNILVLSVDQPLCDLLISKKVPVACIAVPPESFLASTGTQSYEEGIKSRFMVLRLMNFWGYDVASYDSDAVILRNPQHLYESRPDVQVFAGSSYNPPFIANVWGFSACGGTLIVRSHPSTGNDSFRHHMCCMCTTVSLDKPTFLPLPSPPNTHACMYTTSANMWAVRVQYHAQ